MLDQLPAAITTGEAAALGRLIARAYRRTVEFYETEYQLSHADATARAAELLPKCNEHALTGPPEQVTFRALNRLVEADPEQAAVAWERVKQAARDELLSGHRAVGMVATGEAWDRAQFLAVRAAFKDQWQPANAGELLLVDMLAQAYTAYLFWLGQLHTQATTDAMVQDYRREHRTGYKWEPMRISEAQAVEMSAAMADRFNRMFLRTQRQFRDLRRYAPQVTINNPGQVNIGAQQVNAAQVRFEREEGG